LQLAFDWTNRHLHAFRLSKDSYKTNPPQDTFAELFGSDLPRREEKKSRLCDLLYAPEDRLIFEYNFGDS